ncbi:MAG: O-antigen ligase family protein [Proteobacteria bacterium]|nr:O-antigen ligase family protein [Pseudomonadota bacterium]
MSGPARASSVLVAAAALTAPLAVLTPNALAVLLAVAGIAIAVLEPALLRLSHVPSWLVRTLLAFLAFALISLFWALDPAEGFDGWLRIAATAAIGLVLLAKARVLDEAGRVRTGDALLGGYLVACLMLGAQFASQSLRGTEGSLAALWYPPETNFWALFNRSATVLVLVLPLAAGAARRRYGTLAAAGVVAVGAYVTFHLNSMAAELAFAVGLAGALGALALRRWSARLLALALVALMLAAPFVARTDALAHLASRRDVTVSIYHRAAIWGFSGARIAEKPLLGWGMHAARSMPNAKETIGYGAELMPLHPHNGPLHLWLEFGAVGALLGAILLGGLALATDGPAWPRALRTGLLLAALVIASISYGLWQGWWMATLWLVGALAAATPDGARTAA